MKLKTSDIEEVCLLLIKHVRESGYEEIEIDSDHYWEIEKEERYNVYEKPKDLSIGQLSEDWNWLQSYLDKKAEPIGYGLVWCGNILRAVGEKVIG
jgi:hypothetical protein